MNRTVLFVVVAVCLAPLAGVGAAQSTDEVTVTVHVVDDEGNDVGGASVTASWDGGERTGETASNGQVFIDVPSGANVSITAEHDDFVQNNPTEMGTLTDHTKVTVEMFPPTDGEVTVTENDDPVESAAVSLTKRGDDRAVTEGETDADGVFAVESVETGVYEITVEKPGYYDTTASVDLADTNATTVGIESGTSEVTFTVTDRYLEEPLEADVTVLTDGKRDATISTNEKGKRSIDLRVNTAYTVVIAAEGYGESERQLTVGETDMSRSYGVKRAPTLSLEPSNERVLVGETVRVDVTDEYGDPVEGATITVDGSSVGTTDGDGSATVPIETAGSLEFTAETGDTTSSAVTVEGVDPNADGDGDAENDSTSPEESSGDGIPGFGAPVGVIAIAALVCGLLVRHRA
jgi:PGF-CTERM protein